MQTTGGMSAAGFHWFVSPFNLENGWVPEGEEGADKVRWTSSVCMRGRERERQGFSGEEHDFTLCLCQRVMFLFVCLFFVGYMEGHAIWVLSDEKYVTLKCLITKHIDFLKHNQTFIAVSSSRFLILK